MRNSSVELLTTDFADSRKGIRVIRAIRGWLPSVAALGRYVFRGLFLCLALVCLPSSPAWAVDTLDWNTNRNVVTADIKSTGLLEVLEQITDITGWQVFIEPETVHSVSAKFRELPPSEALRLLIGDANYALLPGTNSTSRLFVFRTSRQNATQLVKPAKAEARVQPKVIPNQLIVRLKPGAKIDELARLLGAKVTGRIDSLNAYRLQFDDAAATDSARLGLASNPDVASVENNFAFDRPEVPQSVSGNLPEPQLQLKPPPSNGRTVIGLIDTAVQPFGNSLDQFVLKQQSVVGDPSLEASSPTHGTSMAETMLRTLELLGNGSSSVQILPVDVYGGNETTSTFDVAQGIALAINKGANPINLSLGSTADSQMVRDLIAQGVKQGVSFYAAKGNTPDTTPQFPAGDPGATPVTAVDSTGQVVPWANRASLPAIGAMGTVPVTFNQQTFVVQGTSPATAIVTSTAANLMANGLSAAAANAQLLKSPTRTTLPGK
jgi:ribosomal protein L18